MTALEVDDVTVSYSGVAAVNHLSFALQERETVALIGPNGAGKTTLLNAISGLVRPAAGAIHVLGSRVDSVPPHRLCARGLGRTFQHAHLADELTALENVLVGGYGLRPVRSRLAEAFYLPRGRRAAADEVRRARELLERLGLAHFADEPTGSLPFGVKKLIDLARSLMSGPRLLLMDEPTAGLTEAEVTPLAEVLLRLRESMTILVVAHHMEFVSTVAERVICLETGTKIADGDVDAVRRDPEVINAYLGTELVP